MKHGPIVFACCMFLGLLQQIVRCDGTFALSPPGLMAHSCLVAIWFHCWIYVQDAVDIKYEDVNAATVATLATLRWLVFASILLFGCNDAIFWPNPPPLNSNKSG